MEYKVREMKADDVEEVAALEAHIFTDGWSATSLRESLEQDHVQILVAESQMPQHVIGYHIFYTSLDEGDIARIAVAPECRRMGVAEELLNRMWDFCKSRGIVRILLEVRESNEDAIFLYKKHGFEAIGQRKAYYQNPVENGLIMEKQLDITASN